MKNKEYEGFWLGNTWVSRCKKCGQICFDINQEEDHSKTSCIKQKLKQLTPDEKQFYSRAET